MVHGRRGYGGARSSVGPATLVAGYAYAFCVLFDTYLLPIFCARERGAYHF